MDGKEIRDEINNNVPSSCAADPEVARRILKEKEKKRAEKIQNYKQQFVDGNMCPVEE